MWFQVVSYGNKQRLDTLSPIGIPPNSLRFPPILSGQVHREALLLLGSFLVDCADVPGRFQSGSTGRGESLGDGQGKVVSKMQFRSDGAEAVSSDPRITVTYTMTESRKRKLKIYAAIKGMKVSDILAEFVDGLVIKGGHETGVSLVPYRHVRGSKTGRSREGTQLRRRWRDGGEK